MKNIKKIIDNDKCCGCGSCINVCPCDALDYTKDKYGFTIPNIDTNKCINCGLCLKVCPSNTIRKYNVKKAYASLCIDENIRKNSSSGGIFAIIAKKVLSEGGVVYGCTMDDEFQVKHIRINKIEDLHKIQKSKYVQSYMGNIYKDIKLDLSKNIKVLFSGTPCEVSALRNFLNNKYSDLLLTIDIVCHGVPSQKMFDDYLNCIQNKKGKFKKYEFRTKKKADNGMQWFSSYTKENGKSIVFNWTEDSYNYNYMMGNIYRKNCYSCDYATRDRVSDITLCDYWHWNNYHDEFNKLASVSGVLINSDKGYRTIEEIKDELRIFETSLENIVAHNSCLERPVKLPDKRDILLNMWNENGYKKIEDEFAEEHKLEILKGRIRRAIPNRIYCQLAESLSCLTKFLGGRK